MEKRKYGFSGSGTGAFGINRTLIPTKLNSSFVRVIIIIVGVLCKAPIPI